MSGVGVGGETGPVSPPVLQQGGAAERRVPRDLLPCARPFGGAVINAGGGFGASRAVGRRVRRRGCRQMMVNDMVDSLNSLCGVRAGTDALSTSQIACCDRLQDAVDLMGPPPDVDAAAAFTTLCGSRAGYSVEPCQSVALRLEALSLPPPCVRRAEGDAILRGQALEAWVHWRHVLLNDASSKKAARAKLGIVTPFSDRRLRDKPALYAKFVALLWKSGLVEFEAPSPPTVGAFAVGKKDGRQRLVLDTRVANLEFKTPWHCALPTPGAWACADVPLDGELLMSQADVQCAFYRIKCPVGMSSLFKLPQARVDLLLKEGVTGLGEFSAYTSPCLCVLPMGFSWSLFFCQEMVRQTMVDAGIAQRRLVEDRRVFPDLRLGPAAAAYVDNVCVFGVCDANKINEVSAKVVELLNDRGLECPELTPALRGEVFTGILFDESGVLRPERKRVWKLRLALEHLLDRGRCSGRQLRQIVGHYTWLALLRREGLCVCDVVYRFIEAARDRVWVLWRSVRREVEHMRNLLPVLFCDARLPWLGRLYASDSSGGDDGGCGGYGVVSKDVDPEIARGLGQANERWRYDVEELIAARRAHELDGDDRLVKDLFLGKPASASRRARNRPPGETRPASDVSFVPNSVIGTESEWKLVVRGRWSYPEHINRTEGRAAGIAFRHALRNCDHLGKRIVVLIDNLAVALSLAKGRASAKTMLRTCREIGCLSLFSGARLIARWVPSEHNPSDAASRVRKSCAQDVATVGWDQAWLGMRWRSVAQAALERQLGLPGLPGSACRREAEEESVHDAGGEALDHFDDGIIFQHAGAGPDLAPGLLEPPAACDSVEAEARPVAAPSSPEESSGGQAAMHQESAHQARRMGTSFLEVNTVRAATAKQYMTIVEQFLGWSGITSVRGILPKGLDVTLVEFFEEGYFAGQNAETADRTVAAIAYIEPSLDRTPGAASQKASAKKAPRSRTVRV